MHERQANNALMGLLNLVSVAPLDQETILKAVALGWGDFEDAIQMLSAVDADADYLVTRNTGDFKDITDRLHVQAGDELFVVETEEGVLLTAYGYGLIRNHPFTDGNKRIGVVRGQELRFRTP